MRFGRAGDVPVVGSWTGTTTGLGVVRGRTWLLRRSLTSGAAQIRFRYGKVGDIPVVGSWTGTAAQSGIGVERDGQWLLRNRRSAGPASTVLAYGLATDRAVVGDWDGDGTSTPAVVRGRTVPGPRLARPDGRDAHPDVPRLSRFAASRTTFLGSRRGVTSRRRLQGVVHAKE